MLNNVKTVKGFNFKGQAGKLIKKVEENWLLTVPETNPAIITCFKERERKPYRDFLPWSGEFAGKYITGAYYVYNITHSQKLYDVIEKFIDDLISCMDTDGYLGCFKRGCHLTGKFNNGNGGTWDSWAHYHMMYGMYLWYGIMKKQYIYDAVIKMADLFLNTFYKGGLRVKDTESTEMNLGVIHIFAILYNNTKDKRYLDFIRELEKDVESPEGGGYISCMDSGNDYYQCRKPRWESMHIIMGINEMEQCFNDKKYGDTAEKVVNSIIKTDVHNTGGFSTGEQAVGTPFINDPIELCCVVAFNALANEVYKKRPSAKLADFLEISYYNAIMGSYSPSGRWSTYNTPMEGIKEANYDWINFQSRAGSPDMNCCSANAGRGVGQLYSWAYQEDGDAFYVNFYEAADFETESGLRVKVQGKYPVKPTVKISFDSDKPRKIFLRIPAWSAKTSVNGEKVPAGEYYVAEIPAGKSEFSVRFDFKVRTEEGGLSYKGKKCIFVGPVLFGADMAINEGDLYELPKLRKKDLQGVHPVFDSETGRLMMHLKNGVNVCDFYMLGQSGSVYRTWL